MNLRLREPKVRLLEVPPFLCYCLLAGSLPLKGLQMRERPLQVTADMMNWTTWNTTSPRKPRKRGERSWRGMSNTQTLFTFSKEGHFLLFNCSFQSPESSPCCSCQLLQPAVGESMQRRVSQGFFFFPLKLREKEKKKKIHSHRRKNYKYSNMK